MQVMARVAVTFVVNNLKKESGTEPNVWRLIEHFEDSKTDIDTDAKRVVEEESKFINDTSALLVFDMSSSQLYQYEGMHIQLYSIKLCVIAILRASLHACRPAALYVEKVPHKRVHIYSYTAYIITAGLLAISCSGIDTGDGGNRCSLVRPPDEPSPLAHSLVISEL